MCRSSRSSSIAQSCCRWCWLAAAFTAASCFQTSVAQSHQHAPQVLLRKEQQQPQSSMIRHLQDEAGTTEVQDNQESNGNNKMNQAGKIHSWVWPSKASDTFADSMFYDSTTHSIVFGGNNHIQKYGQSDCIVGQVKLKNLADNNNDTSSRTTSTTIKEERAGSGGGDDKSTGEEGKNNEEESQQQQQQETSFPRLIWSHNYNTAANDACTVVAPSSSSSNVDGGTSQTMILSKVYAFGFSEPNGLMTHMSSSSSSSFSDAATVDPSIYGFAMMTTIAEQQRGGQNIFRNKGIAFDNYKVHYPVAVDTFQNGDLLVGLVVSDYNDVVVSSKTENAALKEFPLGRNFKIVLQRLRPRTTSSSIEILHAPNNDDEQQQSFNVPIPIQSLPTIVPYSGGSDLDFNNSKTTLTENDINVTAATGSDLLLNNMTSTTPPPPLLELDESVLDETNNEIPSSSAQDEDEDGPYFETIWTREVSSDDDDEGSSSTSINSVLSDVRIVESSFLEKEVVLIAGSTSGYGRHIGGGSTTSTTTSTMSNNQKRSYDGFITKLDGDTGNFMNQTAAAYTTRISGHPHLQENVANSFHPKENVIITGICASVSQMDPYGAIFVIGTTNAILDDSTLEQQQNHHTKSPHSTAFVRKLSIDTLSPMWTRHIGVEPSPPQDDIQAILGLTSDTSTKMTDVMGAGCAITNDGTRIYVTGTVTDGGNLPNEETRGGDDIFVASFDTTDGTLHQLNQAGSIHRDVLANHNSILLDKDQNPIIIGTIEGSDTSDVFVLQYDPNGTDEEDTIVPQDSEVVSPTVLYDDNGDELLILEEPGSSMKNEEGNINASRSRGGTRLIGSIVVSCLVICSVAIYFVQDRFLHKRRQWIERERAIQDAIDANCSSPRRPHEHCYSDLNSFFPRRFVPSGSGENNNGSFPTSAGGESSEIEQYDFSGSNVISGIDSSTVQAHDVPNLELGTATRSNYHELLRAYSTYNIHDDHDMEYDDQMYSDEDDLHHDSNIIDHEREPLSPERRMPNVV